MIIPPNMNQDRTFIFHLQKTLKNGEDFILATVIKTWGSAPNPVGSMLIVNALGEIFGSVSGGCVDEGHDLIWWNHISSETYKHGSSMKVLAIYSLSAK